MPLRSLYIGLMSGTSLDGIDAVLVNFDQNIPIVLSSHSFPIPTELHYKLIEFTQPCWRGSIIQLGMLHQQLGQLFASATKELISKSKIDTKDICAIGSHGQTIWHQPEGEFPFSLQLGDANLIAEITQITTVSDFRSRDIAAGGQGAPLVPAFHSNVLSHPKLNRIILNIGGIANISILPSQESGSPVLGFDTGPGNGLIDIWIRSNKNTPFDKNGEWAKSGSIQKNLLNALLADPYFSIPAPKSTGKEYFNIDWLKETLRRELTKYRAEDIQATLTELTAKTIAESIQNLDRINCDEVYICGGGIHNQFLLDRLQNHLPNIPIRSTQTLGVHPDWMEAIAFAWLAKQTMEGKAGNSPSATGAKGPRILGAIYQA